MADDTHDNHKLDLSKFKPPISGRPEHTIAGQGRDENRVIEPYTPERSREAIEKLGKLIKIYSPTDIKCTDNLKPSCAASGKQNGAQEHTP